MNGAGDVLGRPERLELREPGIHFRRCFGAWRVLELHLHAVDGQAFEILFDVSIRCDQTHVAGGGVFADGHVDMTVGTARQ
ncbi:hypothetical protein D9M71_811250 [compost metagenome]